MPAHGALFADGFVDGDNLICGLHNWDYRIDTGVSEYNNEEVLYKFKSLVKDDKVWIDENEVADYLQEHPLPFRQ